LGTEQGGNTSSESDEIGDDNTGGESSSDSLQAVITWGIPSTRENGEDLLLSEIGGYEIQYRLTSANEFTTVVVDQPSSSKYTLDNLVPGEYEVKIATFDTNGVYSQFTPTTRGMVGL